MAIVRKQATIDVVEAANIRLINVFKNGVPVYFSFSGGKDSICMAQILINLISQQKINASQLTVVFIDEEAIFPCIEKSVKEWRQKFILAGAKFEWYCIEVKHYNCFNELENDESFMFPAPCLQARHRAVHRTIQYKKSPCGPSQGYRAPFLQRGSLPSRRGIPPSLRQGWLHIRDRGDRSTGKHSP